MAKTVRIPPQNLDAEKSLLGSILIDPESMIDIIQITKPDHFYDSSNAVIFEVCLDLFERNKPIDVLTVTDQLKKKKQLTRIGGAAYLTDLTTYIPSSSNIEEYANIIKDASTRRRIINLGAKISDLGFDEVKDVPDVINEAEQRFFGITEETVKSDFVHVSKLLEQSYERAEMLSQNQGKLRGIPTGFSGLDNILGGFQDSDLMILAARPGVGKTALSLDIARHVATKEKRNVAFFALEMSNLQLMDRVLSMQVGIGLWDLRMGRLPDESFGRLAEAMGVLSEANLFIDDTPGLNILEMRTKARRLHMEKGIDFIVVDYLQLMEGKTKENRVQEVSEISRFLKVLARELSVPVLALSQLSRAVEQRAGGKPQLSDLRESGSIEQDADIVMFIHREELYNPDTPRQGIADLIVAKHRNGPTGNVELYFVKDQARYRTIDDKHLQN